MEESPHPNDRDANEVPETLGAAGAGFAEDTVRIDTPWWAWPEDSKERLEYFAIVLGVVLAIVGGIIVPVVLFVFSGDRGGGSASSVSSPRTTAPMTTTPTPPAPTTLNVGMSAVGFNESYGRKWGTRLALDSYDQLKLRIKVWNKKSTPTADMVLDLLYQNSYPSFFITGLHARNGGAPTSLGPEVKLDVYSGIGSFWPKSVDIVDEHGDVIRPLQAPLTDNGGSWPANLQYAGSYDLGVIAGHQKRIVDVTGAFNLPGGSQLAGGTALEFRRLPESRTTYTTSGSARPGDRLRFSLLLNNTGFRAASFHIRLQVEPTHAASFVRVAAYDVGDLVNGRPWMLGRVIVNAEDRPIRLSVIPRTTWLWSAGSKCSTQRRLRRLPDGIAKGGLDIGIGGFRSHDPCHGAEFTRFLNFDIAVH